MAQSSLTHLRRSILQGPFSNSYLQLMTKPRSHYVDPNNIRFYHITSRCVRRAFLLGKDPLSGINHDSRKVVFLRRLKHLSRYFTVDVMGYAIMTNHFHLVIRYDPKASQAWSDEEVARRWCAVFHGHPLDASTSIADTVENFDVHQAIRYHELLLNPEQIDRCRVALGSLSRFMQHLKQPFSVWANRQDQCKGHFFETRFYSGVLLDTNDLLSCMAYVDLNPVEAGMAKSLREAKDTSIHERLYGERFDTDRLEAYIAPQWPDDADTEAVQLSVSLYDYARQLNLAIVYLDQPDAELPSRMEHWMARLLNRERHKRRQATAFFDYA